MRIVHEIESEAQVGGGFNPYSKRKGAKKSEGMVGELLISAKIWGSTEDEAIYIEGDAAHIRQALIDAIHVIDSCAQVYKDELASNWQRKKSTSKKKRTEDKSKTAYVLPGAVVTRDNKK